jgi:adenylate kinase
MRQDKNNLIFIGGIHGVGKGTICKEISRVTNANHIIASDLLKWYEISNVDNKNVANIKFTQDRLVTGLNKVINKNELPLLDGNFCLFNSIGETEKIPKETFIKINPRLIAIVTTSVNKIQERLQNRDGKIYNLDKLKEMQITEMNYAKQIA